MILVSAFIACITDLFVLRFDAGDIYPHYSSLRSDPLGTRVIYETMGLLKGIGVSRFYRPLNKLAFNENTVFLVIGQTAKSNFSVINSVEAVQTFIHNGGRFVVTYYPVAAPKIQTATPEKESSEASEQGFTLGSNPIFPEPVKLKDGSEVKWHSSLYFKDLSRDWTVEYFSGDKPVVISKQMGKGSLLLVSDSWFISNEALKNDRHGAFISFILQDKKTVIFDEFHHGVSKKPGIVYLIKKYNLSAFFCILGAGWVLIIWKSLFSLTPADKGNGEPSQSETDYSRGFTNLLKKNIAPSGLLSTCISTWKQDSSHGFSKNDISDQIETIGTSGLDPVQGYREICRLVRRLKKEEQD
jgi:hypothetical protein